MKISAELAFFAKLLEKGILSTPFNYAGRNYVRANWIIYSDLIFQNDLTWLLVNQAYTNAKADDDLTKLKTTIEEVKSWREISLEDINTYDALGNVAWINGSNYWIDIKTLEKYRWMISKAGHLSFRMRSNDNGLLAFTSQNNEWDSYYEDVFVITGLQSIQRSLLD